MIYIYIITYYIYIYINKPSITSVVSVSFWLRSLFSDASKIWLLPHLLRQTSAVWDSEPRATLCETNGAACSSAGFAGKSCRFCGRFQQVLKIETYSNILWNILKPIDWVKLWPKRLSTLWRSLGVDLDFEGGGTRTWVDIGNQTHSTTTFFSGMPMAEQTSFTHLSSWLSISQSLIMLP